MEEYLCKLLQELLLLFRAVPFKTAYEIVVVYLQLAAKHQTAIRSPTPLPQWGGGENWKGKSEKTRGLRDFNK